MKILRRLLKGFRNLVLFILGMAVILVATTLPFWAAEVGGHTAGVIVATIYAVGIIGAISWDLGS